jgi:hypothetical protein
MALNIDKEVTEMKRMSVRDLQQKFVDVCGEQPRSHNRQWLIKRLAWKLQAREYGGLSQAALRRAKEIADTCDLSDLRVTAPKDFVAAIPLAADVAPQQIDSRLPMAGSVLTRKYKGKVLCVEVLVDGFRFEGERFKSLSAVARKITGAAWNGFLFFGLANKKVRA